MLALFGNIALYLALAAGLLQSLPTLIGYRHHNPYLLAFARPSLFAQFTFILVAYILLTIAFINNDFSIAYVAANSHPHLPFMYRLTAIWGAHEGSILLWIVNLASWSLVFSFSQRHTHHFRETNLVIAILGILSACFLSFLIFTSNPFLPAMGSLAGRDLNPLLQDPGFIIHPPMLYTGYVGFSVAFAITLGALISGTLNIAWAKLTRRFALAAWCFLTLGIALGSWWAYRVLGWGGFWFWDPVENASLLPWLAGTALIHLLALTEKRDAFKNWGAILAITTFTLSLLGTFLVRSGVLVSAHTFAADPQRGLFLLLLLAALLTAALAIYIARIPTIVNKNILLIWYSRETALLLNSILLFVIMLTVLLGTLYPLLLDALHLGTISVGAPYFNTVMTPFAFILLALIALVPLTQWQDHTIVIHWKPILKNAALATTVTLIALFVIFDNFNFFAFIFLSLSIWLLLNTRYTYKKSPGMSLAHIGFGILMIGIMLSSHLNQEKTVRLHPGNAATIGPYQFFFIDTSGIDQSNYRGIRATFDVIKNTHHVTFLYPEKRIYTVRDMIMTKVDIHPGIFRDLYIALGEPLDDNAWSVRIYYKPFIRWIWFGALLMTIGGMLSLLSRNKKIKE